MVTGFYEAVTASCCGYLEVLAVRGQQAQYENQKGPKAQEESEWLSPPTQRAFFQLRHPEQPTITHLRVLNLATICCS